MLIGLYLGKTGITQGQILGKAASGSNECVRGEVVDDEVTNMLREEHRQDFQFTMVQVQCAEMAARAAETATAELERLVQTQAARIQELAKAQVPTVVVNKRGSGIQHKVANNYTLAHPPVWRTVCGGRHAKAPVSRAAAYETCGFRAIGGFRASVGACTVLRWVVVTSPRK